MNSQLAAASLAAALRGLNRRLASREPAWRFRQADGTQFQWVSACSVAMQRVGSTTRGCNNRKQVDIPVEGRFSFAVVNVWAY